MSEWIWTLMEWYWQGKPQYLETNLHNTNMPTRSPTWTDLGLNPALRSRRPANNRLSCSTDLSERNSTGDLDVSGRIALKLILESYGVRVWCRLKLLRIGFSGALSVDRWIPQRPFPVPIVQEARWTQGPVCKGTENVYYWDSTPGPSSP